MDTCEYVVKESWATVLLPKGQRMDTCEYVVETFTLDASLEGGQHCQNEATFRVWNDAESRLVCRNHLRATQYKLHQSQKIVQVEVLRPLTLAQRLLLAFIRQPGLDTARVLTDCLFESDIPYTDHLVKLVEVAARRKGTAPRLMAKDVQVRDSPLNPADPDSVWTCRNRARAQWVMLTWRHNHDLRPHPLGGETPFKEGDQCCMVTLPHPYPGWWQDNLFHRDGVFWQPVWAGASHWTDQRSEEYVVSCVSPEDLAIFAGTWAGAHKLLPKSVYRDWSLPLFSEKSRRAR